MKRNSPPHVLCVQTGAGNQALPASAVVVVVVVLLITVGLPVFGMTTETVVPAVVVGGLMGKELVRGLVTVFSLRQER
ncbi:hypothetical protein ACWDO7_16970 [Streptomyces sp. NPDC003656]